MKKFFVSLLVILTVLSLVSAIGCKKRANPNGPVDAITLTPTNTPDFSYTVYLQQNKTPVPGTNVKMTGPADCGGQTLSGQTALATGSFAFSNLNAAGAWSLYVEGSYGFDSNTYQVTANPTSNTFTVIDRGVQTLTLSGISGPANAIPLQGCTCVFNAVYHTMAPKVYQNIQIVGIPAGVSYTVSTPYSTQKVEQDGDTVVITLYFQPDETDYGTGFSFYVTSSDTLSNILSSGSAFISKGWTFNIQGNGDYQIAWNNQSTEVATVNFSVANLQSIFTGFNPVGAVSFKIIGTPKNVGSLTTMSFTTNNSYSGGVAVNGTVNNVYPFDNFVATYTGITVQATDSGSLNLKFWLKSPIITQLCGNAVSGCHGNTTLCGPPFYPACGTCSGGCPNCGFDDNYTIDNPSSEVTSTITGISLSL